jgi:hypothetical protein
MDQCLLVLIVTPTIENAVVDWLLERDDVPGFSSAPINGHGTSAHSLTPAEQVAGRQRQIMFQLHLLTTTAEALVEALRESFSGSAMHYWLTPVLASGHLK